MNAVEKKEIYTLLKAAKSWTYGYTAPEFNGNEPQFADDIEAPVVETSTASTEPATQPPASGITIDSVAAKINACHNCVLSRTRKNVVPGEGVAHPVVMVIGEGPGEDEDNTGRPFVGKAGQLLDKMLAAIELDRTCNCYIANIVKCRPPMNRNPMPDEAAACQGYLEAQIHLLKPVLILAAGRTAVQNLLHTSEGINALRGKFFDYHLGGNNAGSGNANQNNGPVIPLMATFHPSALLRDENLKRPAWDDLKVFRAKLLELSPDYATSFKEKHSKA